MQQNKLRPRLLRATSEALLFGINSVNMVVTIPNISIQPAPIRDVKAI